MLYFRLNDQYAFIDYRKSGNSKIAEGARILVAMLFKLGPQTTSVSKTSLKSIDQAGYST